MPTSDPNTPVYAIAGNNYLEDRTGRVLLAPTAWSFAYRALGTTNPAVVLQAEVAALQDFVAQVQARNNSAQPGLSSRTSTPNALEGLRGGSGAFNGLTDGFNDLRLEIINTNPVTTNLWLRLDGTVGGDNYQLLSVTNLLATNWTLGEILFSASDGYTDFSPLPMTNAMTFYRAHHADPVMEITNGQYAIEPNPTNNDPGQVGIFYVQNEGSASTDVTVYYSIGGTAQNGVDYSNLTGVVTIPANQSSAEIDIQPLADGLKPNQAIILTLTQNTNYLVDPDYFSATNTLYANPEVYPRARGDTKYPCPNTPFPFDLSLDASDPRSLPLTYFDFNRSGPRDTDNELAAFCYLHTRRIALKA